MTSYTETFHRRNGVYVPGNLLTISELTPRWGVGSAADYQIQDARAGDSNDDQWGLTIEESLPQGVDVRFLKMETATVANFGGFSITRAPSFADGSIAACGGFGTTGLALWLRASGAIGAETGYLCQFFRTSGLAGTHTYRARIYKVAAGVYTQLAESAAIEVATDGTNGGPTITGAVLNCEFKASGTTLSARFWEQTEARPDAWDVTAVNGDISAAGWAVAGSGSTSSNAVGKVARLGYISVCDSASEDVYIPKNRDQRRDFLRNSSEVSVVLFEAGVLGSSDGGTTGVSAKALISNTGYTSDAGEEPANTTYPSRILSLGEFSQQVSGQDDLTGRAVQGFGDVIVHNTNGALDEWLRWNWTGRPFSILIGARGWKKCDFVLGARGVVDRLEQRSRTELAFKLRDGSSVLARRLERGTVGGTGINAEKPAPVVLGTCFNVKPVLKDDTTHVYRYHEASTADATGVTSVREGGNVISGSPGSLHSDTPASGEFRLSASPTADITIDVVGPPSSTVIFGTKTVSYPTFNDATTYNDANSHNGIFKLLTYLYSVLELDQIYAAPELGTVGIRTDGYGYVSGIYVSSDEDPTIDSILDMLVKSAHGCWFWNAWGELMARYLDLSSAYNSTVYPTGFVLDMQEAQFVGKKLTCRRIIPPALPRKFYYQKNWFIQNSLVGVAEANRELYGTPGSVASYEPAGSGLDQPSNHIGARDLEPKMTLLRYNPTDYAGDQSSSMIYRENVGNSKEVGLFEFETQWFFEELEVMRFVDFTHSRYGFENGARGTVIGTRKNFRNRSTIVTMAVQLPGDWPAVTSAYPYVGSSEFE